MTKTEAGSCGRQGEFQKDLGQIAVLQASFDRSLGREGKTEDVIRSYNPVLARWKFEQLSTGVEKNNFKRYEVFQMQTNLRERFRAAKSSVLFTSDEYGNAYNELFPDEPLDVMLQRGIEYRKQQGSPELEREEAELCGWVAIRKKLLDSKTPLGSKFISISSPGVVEGTTYTDNFVDIYESVVDPLTKKRGIRMTRNASEMKYGEYFDRAVALKPDYFDQATGPIDAWFLGNPIFIDSQKDKRSVDDLFTEVFTGRTDAMKEEMFGEIYTACLPLVLYYIDILTRDQFDPQEVAIAFNAILKKADNAQNALRREKDDTYSVANNASYLARTGIIFSSIQQEVAFLGRQKIDGVKVGCGFSGGYEIDGGLLSGKTIDSGSSFMSNSVGKFGVKGAAESKKDAKDDPNLCRCGGRDAHFHCPGEKNGEKCKHAIVVGKGTTRCPSCGAGKVC